MAAASAVCRSRGLPDKPEAKGQYADFMPGLVYPNGPPSLDLDTQIELFEQALDELETDLDLVNFILEITCEDHGPYVRRYQLQDIA